MNTYTDTLQVNEILRVGEYLLSQNGSYFAILPENGNFSIYQGSGPSNQGNLLWSLTQNGGVSQLPPAGAYFALLPDNGNFSIGRGSGPADSLGSIWSFSRGGGMRQIPPTGTYFARLENNGALCIYQGTPLEAGALIWNIGPAPDITLFLNSEDTLQWRLSSGGTVTWSQGRLKWSGRFIAISQGLVSANDQTSWSGDRQFLISMPKNDISAQDVYDNKPRSVIADGILLNGRWEGLYVVYTPGGNVKDMRFKIVSHEHNFSVPGNWLLIALVNPDDNSLQLGTGTTVADRSSSALGGSLPCGTILMWSGTTIDTIPRGWALCDGKNGTPDLRSRFVVGAGPNDQPGTSGDPTSHSHTLSVPQATFTTSLDAGHSHRQPDPWYDRSAPLYAAVTNGSWAAIDRASTSVDNDTARTQVDGSHSHTVNMSLSSTTTSAVATELRPRWYALCFIMKLF